MDETRYETLLDENTNLKKALSSTRHILERTLNDYETLKQIHEDFKNQYEKLKRENEDSHQKYLQLLGEKKDMENQFDNTIRTFKIAIEQKQKELEDVQTRVLPSLDHDMIRIKIINELEIPHRQALDNKQQENDKLQDQVYELKRQLDILNTKYEAVKFEAEKDIKDLKERHKLELNDLMIEIQTLHERVDDTKDKEVIRALRRELDELKYKYEESENEMEDLRREKEKLREEKNDILIRMNKQLENEKTEKRNFKTECDKLNIKIRQFENENSTFHNKLADRDGQISRLKKENEKYLQDIDAKQKNIATLQTQIRELEETQGASQSKLQEFIAQTQLYDHEKHISEKNRIAALQREIEGYQKTILDLENKNRNANFQMLKDMDTLKQENQRVNDLYSQLQRNFDVKESEVKSLRRDCDSLQDELYFIQKKNKELSLKDDAGTVKLPNRDKDSQLLKDALAREEKLKTKVLKLKTKLKQANAKLMELLPLKVFSQQDPNKIFRDTNSRTIDNLEVSGSRGTGLIESLKQKYGFNDLPTRNSDVKNAGFKYGGSDNSYLPETDKIITKYSSHAQSYQQHPQRDDESLIHDEISRAAEEGLYKYGINPNTIL